MAEVTVNDFQVREHHLAKEWGVKLVALAEARRAYLRQNLHWQWRDIAVWYSPSGLEELRKYVTVKAPEERLAEKETQRQAAIARRLPNTYPLSETIVAVDRVWPNPRLIRCVNHHQEPVNVRVRSNTNFRRGMRLNLETQCTWRTDQETSQSPRTGYYELKDPPPRYPGRW